MMKYVCVKDGFTEGRLLNMINRPLSLKESRGVFMKPDLFRLFYCCFAKDV